MFIFQNTKHWLSCRQLRGYYMKLQCNGQAHACRVHSKNWEGMPLCNYEIRNSVRHFEWWCFKYIYQSSWTLTHNRLYGLAQSRRRENYGFHFEHPKGNHLRPGTIHTIVAHSMASCCMSSVMSAFFMIAFLSSIPDFSTIFAAILYSVSPKF